MTRLQADCLDLDLFTTLRRAQPSFPEHPHGPPRALLIADLRVGYINHMPEQDLLIGPRYSLLTPNLATRPQLPTPAQHDVKPQRPALNCRHY